MNDPFADPKLGVLPLATRMLYLGILHLAEGDEVVSSPQYLKGRIFPYDEEITVAAVAAMTEALVSVGKIHRMDATLLISDPPKAKTKGAAGTAVARSTGRSSALAVREKDDPRDPFVRFWSAYPRSVGKLAARKAFLAKVAVGADPEEIVAAADRYGVRCRLIGKEPQYTPHPSTWLNEGRWMDPEEEAPTVRSKTDDVLRQNLDLTAYYAQLDGIDPNTIGRPGGPVELS